MPGSFSCFPDFSWKEVKFIWQSLSASNFIISLDQKESSNLKCFVYIALAKYTEKWN